MTASTESSAPIRAAAVLRCWLGVTAICATAQLLVWSTMAWIGLYTEPGHERWSQIAVGVILQSMPPIIVTLALVSVWIAFTIGAPRAEGRERRMAYALALLPATGAVAAIAFTVWFFVR